MKRAIQPLAPIAALFLLAALLLAGCKPEPTTTGGGTSGDKPPVSAGGPGKAASETSDKLTPVVEIPEDLKHDGYHWLGLANSTPMKYALTDQTGVVQTGTMTVKPVSVKDGVAMFEVERTDALAVLGNDRWALEKGGVFSVGNSKSKSAYRDQQANASMAPGDKWQTSSKMTMDADGSERKLEQKLAYRVVGTEKVKTKAGEQEALLLKVTGEMIVDGQKRRIDASAWYVKDKGMVKNVLNITDPASPKDPAQVITIEETK